MSYPSRPSSILFDRAGHALFASDTLRWRTLPASGSIGGFGATSEIMDFGRQ